MGNVGSIYDSSLCNYQEINQVIGAEVASIQTEKVSEVDDSFLYITISLHTLIVLNSDCCPHSKSYRNIQFFFNLEVL